VMSFSLASFERRLVAGLEADAAAVCLRLGGCVVLVDACEQFSCDGIGLCVPLWMCDEAHRRKSLLSRT
jgi:hypothetical protein